MKTINASEFKAKCLAILDEVAETGEVLTILKHGKPVAQLVPPVPRSAGFPQEALSGTVELLDDIVEPVIPADAWEAERGLPVEDAS
jgi:prevent-host-death family protein